MGRRRRPNSEDYLELKTVELPPKRGSINDCRITPRIYLQSYLLGVPELAIGYRHNGVPGVFCIKRKDTKTILEDVMRHFGEFDVASSMGRAHAILDKLLEYFRSPGNSISPGDKFELHVYENGDAWVQHLNPIKKSGKQQRGVATGGTRGGNRRK